MYNQYPTRFKLHYVRYEKLFAGPIVVPRKLVKKFLEHVGDKVIKMQSIKNGFMPYSFDHIELAHIYVNVLLFEYEIRETKGDDVTDFFEKAVASLRKTAHLKYHVIIDEVEHQISLNNLSVTERILLARNNAIEVSGATPDEIIQRVKAVRREKRGGV